MLSGRSGERRSSAKGAGIEFADHRPYRPGDDLRHSDPRLFARFGRHYLREHFEDRQLGVAVVVDGSASMRFGQPSKFDSAMQLAALFGFVALSAGDRLSVTMLSGQAVQQLPPLQNATQVGTLFAWLEQQSAGGGGAFTTGLPRIAERLSHVGLIILISDWWSEHLEQELRVLDQLAGEILMLRVLAPEEIDPSLYGSGAFRFVDVESAAEQALEIDGRSLKLYRQVFDAYRAALAQKANARRGRFIDIRSDANLGDLFLRQFPEAGVLI